MRRIIRQAFLAAGLVVASWGGQSAHAQCFDLTKLGDWDTFRCLNYDLKIVSRDEEKVTYGWVASKAPDDHPRQTLITESGKDGLCGELDMLPPDDTISVCLSSDVYTEKDSAKASVCACYYTVTAEKPVVVLRYAAVMHTPGHEIATKPGFEDYAQPNIHINVIRLSDDGQQVLDCPSVAFYPADSASVLDWKEGTDTLGNPLIWKDWSVMPIDLSAYVGERMVLMLTVYDCAESDYEADSKHIVLCKEETRHQARLYFSLGCESRSLQIEQTCDKNDSTILTAPEHFKVRWFDKANPDVTLSTDRIWRFATSAEDVTYGCELTGGDCEPVLMEQFVYAKKVYTEKVSLGYGLTYTWDKNGQTYTHSASVSDTVRHLTTGCDSIIYNLRLSIKADSCDGVFTMVHDTVCADMSHIAVLPEYTVGGMDKYSLRFSEEAQKAGFRDVTDAELDDSDTIVIPMPNADDSDSLNYPRPGTYSFTLVENNSCEETVEHRLSFTLLYPSWVVFQRWDDVLSVANNRFNGGYEVSSVRWFKNGKEVQGHGTWYVEKNGFDYTAGDEYYAELTRKDDGRAVCTCALRPKKQTPETKFADEVAVSVQPHREGNARSLRVVTELSGTYTVYDIWGRCIRSGVFGDAYGSPDIQMNETGGAGTFLVLFRTSEGLSVTKKLVID